MELHLSEILNIGGIKGGDLVVAGLQNQKFVLLSQNKQQLITIQLKNVPSNFSFLIDCLDFVAVNSENNLLLFQAKNSNPYSSYQIFNVSSLTFTGKIPLNEEILNFLWLSEKKEYLLITASHKLYEWNPLSQGVKFLRPINARPGIFLHYREKNLLLISEQTVQKLSIVNPSADQRLEISRPVSRAFCFNQTLILLSKDENAHFLTTVLIETMEVVKERQLPSEAELFSDVVKFVDIQGKTSCDAIMVINKFKEAETQNFATISEGEIKELKSITSRNIDEFQDDSDFDPNLNSRCLLFDFSNLSQIYHFDFKNVWIDNRNLFLRKVVKDGTDKAIFDGVFLSANEPESLHSNLIEEEGNTKTSKIEAAARYLNLLSMEEASDFGDLCDLLLPKQSRQKMIARFRKANLLNEEQRIKSVLALFEDFLAREDMQPLTNLIFFQKDYSFVIKELEAFFAEIWTPLKNSLQENLNRELLKIEFLRLQIKKGKNLLKILEAIFQRTRYEANASQNENEGPLSYVKYQKLSKKIESEQKDTENLLSKLKIIKSFLIGSDNFDASNKQNPRKKSQSGNNEFLQSSFNLEEKKTGKFGFPKSLIEDGFQKINEQVLIDKGDLPDFKITDSAQEKLKFIFSKEQELDAQLSAIKSDIFPTTILSNLLQKSKNKSLEKNGLTDIQSTISLMSSAQPFEEILSIILYYLIGLADGSVAQAFVSKFKITPTAFANADSFVICDSLVNFVQFSEDSAFTKHKSFANQLKKFLYYFCPSINQPEVVLAVFKILALLQCDQEIDLLLEAHDFKLSPEDALSLVRVLLSRQKISQTYQLFLKWQSKKNSDPKGQMNLGFSALANEFKKVGLLKNLSSIKLQEEDANYLGQQLLAEGDLEARLLSLLEQQNLEAINLLLHRNYKRAQNLSTTTKFLLKISFESQESKNMANQLEDILYQKKKNSNLLIEGPQIFEKNNSEVNILSKENETPIRSINDTREAAGKSRELSINSKSGELVVDEELLAHSKRLADFRMFGFLME